jgi:hypothetical protein
LRQKLQKKYSAFFTRKYKKEEQRTVPKQVLGGFVQKITQKKIVTIFFSLSLIFLLILKILISACRLFLSGTWHLEKLL